MEDTSQPQRPQGSRRAMISGAGLLVVLGSVALVFSLRGSQPLPLSSALPSASIASQVVPEPPPPDENVLKAKRLVGSWQQEFLGQRTLTIAADGTAKMVIEPAGIWVLGFGRRLDIELFWSVKDGHLIYGITSGTPPEKVAVAIKSWGDKWDEEIVTLTDEKLILLEASGDQSEWERVKPDEKGATETVEEK